MICLIRQIRSEAFWEHNNQLLRVHWTLSRILALHMADARVFCAWCEQWFRHPLEHILTKGHPRPWAGGAHYQACRGPFSRSQEPRWRAAHFFAQEDSQLFDSNPPTETPKRNDYQPAYQIVIAYGRATPSVMIKALTTFPSYIEVC